MANVQVANVAPTLISFNLPTAGWFEGIGQDLSANAFDPGFAESLQYLWTFTPEVGNPTRLGGSNPTFSPGNNGRYTVTLTVTDQDGAETFATLGTITVANVAPNVEALTLPTGLVEEDRVQLVSPRVVDVEADLSALTYTWTITLPNGTTQTLNGSVIEVPLNTSGNYGVRLVVTDPDGGQTVRTGTLTVANLPPVFINSTIPTR